MDVGNWRPITLLNVDYKILTKTLVLRLSQVLPDIIHSDQKGFVKKRYSGENVLDVYAMIQQAYDNNEEHVLLMLDIQKAFDSVSLHYLEEVMHAFNLLDSLIRWVRILYSGKEIRITNNGHSSDPIHPLNGTAQGCSLSPLLFVLVMESLALNIRSNAQIEGFQAGGYCKKIAMLADDTLLALKAEKVSFENALITLREFAIVSNLRLNHSKSVVIPLNLSPATKEMLAPLSNFHWLDQPCFKYIGTFIDVDPKWAAPSCLSQVLPELRRILNEKSNPSISILGRIVIVQSLIALWLTHPFMLAPSPTLSELTAVRRLCIDYVWSQGTHHISYDILIQQFRYGGHNMYSVENQERAVKLSWITWLLSPTPQFWKAHLMSQFKIPILQVFNANATIGTVRGMLKKGCHLHSFWNRIFELWCQKHYTKIPYKDAPMAFNTALKTNMVSSAARIEAFQFFAITTSGGSRIFPRGGREPSRGA